MLKFHSILGSAPDDVVYGFAGGNINTAFAINSVWNITHGHIINCVNLLENWSDFIKQTCG